MKDNFEEVRAAGKGKRARVAKPEPVAAQLAVAQPVVPIEADIAAVTLVEQLAPEPVAIPEPIAPQPAADFSAETIKEEATMATTAETVTDTANATMNKGAQIFTDMNERAKGAADRGTKLFDEMNGFAKGNVEAMVESGRIAARGFESMSREAADYARRSFEQASANMRELASVKSPTEFVRLQAEQTRTAFDQAVAQTSHNTETMLKLAGEIAQPLSNRFAVAADRVKSAA